MKKYELHFLNDREFDRLPYKHARESLGLADPDSGKAYVRRTGLKPLDEFVTEHEITELVAKISPHEEDGIRYKKGGVARFIVPALLSLVPGVGPVLAAASNVGMSQYAKAGHPEQLGEPGKPLDIIGSGLTGYFGGKALAGGLTGAVTGGTAAAPGFMSKAAGIGSGLLKGALTGSNGLQIGSTNAGAKAASDMIYSSIKPGTGVSAAKAGASSPWAGAGNAAGLGAGAALGFSQAGDVAPGLPTQTATAAGATTPGSSISTNAFGSGLTNPTPFLTPSQPATSTAQNMGFQAPQATTASQAGSLMGQSTGNMIANTGLNATKTPMLEQLLGANWRQTLLGTAIPAVGQFFTPGAQTFSPEQSQLFNDTVSMVKSGAQVQLTPDQQRAINANYDTELEQARQNLMDRYRYLRPNSDVSNDTQMAEAMRELESDYAEKRANALASAQLGLSQQQTQMMGELANMEINTLAQKAGIQAQQAKEFKDMLSSLGYMVGTSNQIFTGQTDEQMKADAYKKYQAGDRSPEILKILNLA